MFHGHFSGSQFRGFLRGFGREEKNWEGTPRFPMLNAEWQLRARTVINQFETNDTALEYEVTGDPIDETKFCQRASSTPDGTTCSICASDFEDLESNETAVVTKCGHYYHFNCLDCWMNRSDLPNSNSCPSCRTILCKRRERVHAPQQANAHSPDAEEVTDTTANPQIRQALLNEFCQITLEKSCPSSDCVNEKIFQTIMITLPFYNVLPKSSLFSKTIEKCSDTCGNHLHVPTTARALAQTVAINYC